jgi:beta-glucosidase
LGGWGSREIADRFAEYAQVMARRLGDRVRYWITHNEPLVMAMSGHLLGEHAPGIKNPLIALQTGHNLLLSHGLAVAALRSTLPAGAQVGITLNLNPIHPASTSEEDQEAAQRAEALMNGLFLDPLYHGRYPDELGALFGPLAPKISPLKKPG